MSGWCRLKLRRLRAAGGDIGHMKTGSVVSHASEAQYDASHGNGQNFARVGNFSDLVHDSIKQMHKKQEEFKGMSPRAQSKTRRAWRGPATRDGELDVFLHVW